MEITDVKIRTIEGNEKLKAYATVIFDDALVIHNIKIISSDEGLFIAMPSRKMTNGEFKDVVHPISKDFRDLLTRNIIEQYNAEAVK
jgi:stage V sporulation protein G